MTISVRCFWIYVSLCDLKDACLTFGWRVNFDTHIVPFGFPRWLSSKESICQERDSGSIPGLGKYPGEGNGNPLQSSCLKNPMDRGDLQATVHVVARESDRTERLSTHTWCIVQLKCYFEFMIEVLKNIKLPMQQISLKVSQSSMSVLFNGTQLHLEKMSLLH